MSPRGVPGAGGGGGGSADPAVAGGGEGAEGGARAQAEAAWRARAGARVFRMGAIYGPGRSALEAVRRGEAAAGLPGARGGPGEARRRRRFTARIHVDDAARVVVTSMAASDAPGRVYNVVDDDPTSRADVIAHARGLLGLADPDEASAAEQASAAGFSLHVDEKRVRNARIKDELGVRLLYPSYVDGLRACLAAEGAAADAHTQPPTNDDDAPGEASPGETC